MNRIIYIIIYLIILSLFTSCGKSKKINYYDNDGNLKEIREFFSLKDTSSYYLTSFFPNGKICEEGLILHSKKEGEWKNWYADGTIRGEVFYKEGEPDWQYKNREDIDIILDVDTLKRGIMSNVRIINRYPSDGISCQGAKMFPSEDRSYSDFIIVPNNDDSVHFYYVNTMGKNVIVIDSVRLKASTLLQSTMAATAPF